MCVRSVHPTHTNLYHSSKLQTTENAWGMFKVFSYSHKLSNLSKYRFQGDNLPQRSVVFYFQPEFKILTINAYGECISIKFILLSSVKPSVGGVQIKWNLAPSFLKFRACVVFYTFNVSAPNVTMKVNTPGFKYQAQRVVAIYDNKIWLYKGKKACKGETQQRFSTSNKMFLPKSVLHKFYNNLLFVL